MTDIDSNVANAAAPTRPQPNRWAGQIWAFVTAVGIGNLLFAMVAGVVGAWLVTEPDNGGGVAAAVLVLLAWGAGLGWAALEPRIRQRSTTA